ncbi:MAG: hypothetical protein JKY37_05710, partial [Nannocystaceae bacterium]|nr:hypothetical protein [Nannocystaceae bacterium]
MTPEQLHVTGLVVDIQTGAPLVGIRVIMHDPCATLADSVMVGTTNARGEFSLSISSTAAGRMLQSSSGESTCDTPTEFLFFREATKVGESVTAVSMGDLVEGRFRDTFKISAPNRRLQSFAVRGRVIDANGRGSAGVTVILLDATMGSGARLGTTQTDAEGRYVVAYESTADATSGKPSKDLQIHVTKTPDFGESGDLVELAKSAVVFDAAADHTVDVIVEFDNDRYLGATEFERLEQALAPHLDSKPAAGIDAQALEVLAKRADVYPPHLGMFVQAARLGRSNTVALESWYALLRTGLPTALPELVRQSREGIAGALRAAYDQRLVPVPSPSLVAPTIDAVVAELASLRIDAMLLSTTGGPHTTVRESMDTSGLDVSQIRAFAELWDAHDGTKEEFFTELATEFDQSVATALEFTARAAALTDNFLPALNALQASRASGAISTLEDLAAWDTSQWVSFLTPVGAPSDLPGDTQTDQIQRYAETMNRIVEAEYPMQVLARRLQRDTPPSTAGVQQFLDANSDFDIRTSVIPVYFADNTISLDETTESNLRQVQRVYAVAPPLHRYAVTRVLLDLEIASAAEIVRIGPSSFVERFGASFDGIDPRYSGESMAGQVYRNAAARNGVAVALMAQYAAPTNAVNIAATQTAQLSWPGAVGATLERMFGNQDFCGCEHCKSQFGPAAYFVALLAKLQHAPAVALSSALEVLRARRADLPALLLSCESSNTVLPYIDLVNELLEQLATGTTPPPANQTTWSPAELRVHPEHEISAAYDGPGVATFPWSLPFHLPTVETREYMKALGVPRAESMATLSRTLSPPPGLEDAAEDADLVAEKFGMTRLELQIISDSTAYETSVVPDTSVLDAWQVAPAGPLPGGVGAILETTGIDYSELESLIELRFLSPVAAPLSIASNSDDPSCDLADLILTGLNEDAADRLHRFVRLSRRVELSGYELSTAIETLGSGTLDYVFVKDLAALLEVRDRLGLGFSEAVALWRRIPTWSSPNETSLYDRLFLDRRVDGTPGPEFQLTAGEPAVQNERLTAHRETIRGAIRINDTDFDRLLADLGLEDADATFANLSTLYRHTRLAKALGVGVDGMLRLLHLLGVDPFSGPQQTLAFLALVSEVGATSMSIEEVDYICRDQSSDESGVALIADQIDDVLSAIDEGVLEIDERLAETQTGTVYDSLLSVLDILVADPAVVSGVMAWIALPGDLPNPATELEALLEGIVPDPGAMAGSIVPIVDTDDRADALLLTVRPILIEREREALLSKILGDFGAIAAIDALELASDRLTIGLVSVREVLLNEAHVSRRDAVVLFHKAALLVRGLEIRIEDFEWYFGAPQGPQSLDLNGLPLSPQDDEQGRFAQWRALAVGQDLRGSFTDGVNAQLAIEQDQGTVAAAVDILEDATEWGRENIEWAVGGDFLDMTVGDFNDPLLIRRIRDVATLVLRTGAYVARLVSWSRGIPLADDVVELKRSVRSRYGDGQWASAITPVSDRIREQKRDALVDFLIGRGDFANVQAIYDALLVDTQMNACTLTSRLKLAISSCQLFVQRGLIGLESDTVRFSEEFAKYWPRAKNYRVWEAGRKVFFYPENWIEPELRLDKTPFFEELESDLDQGELSEENVERAFKNYLYRLDEVANLEIVSIYQEKRPESFATTSTGEYVRMENPLGTVHVVGRTRTEPRAYFYRKRVLDAVWSPWSRIELEIKGDNISIVQFKDRVFLFWAELQGVAVGDDDDLSIDEPRYYRANFSWSEARGTSWTTAKSISPTDENFVWERRSFVLTTRSTSANLVIELSRDDVNHWLPSWGFRYDCCLETLVPIDVTPPKQTRFGRPSSRSALSQRQVAFVAERLAMVEGWDWANGAVAQENTVLSSIYQDFSVTQSYQNSPYFGRTPAVFNDGQHALYMLPFRVRAGEPVGSPMVSWPGYVLEYDELAVVAPEPAPRVEPSYRGVQIEQVWGGVVPGELSVGSTTGASPSAGTPEVLAQSVAIAEAASSVEAIAGASDPITSLSGSSSRRYRLDNFNHPYTCEMLRGLNLNGIDGVLAASGSDRRQQRHRRYITDDTSDMSSKYIQGPSASLATDPKDEYDFGFGAAYGQYNWELFFHIPLLIAERFRRDQRFEEAARWYHYIFNPRQGQAEGVVDAARFWNIKPLYNEATDGPQDIIQEIFTGGDLNVGSKVVQEFLASIAMWLHDPFDPHGIASVRAGTYRWVVVRKYLDNLIDWADSLFRRDTIESINEATQLYMLAAAILGDKPQHLASIESTPVAFDGLDFQVLFGGLVELESFNIATPPVHPPGPSFSPGGQDDDDGFLLAAGVVDPPPEPLWWYFCLPPNPQLLAYWDTVSDRMFKIRNCQNIEGVTRQLALFAPPIDPALLVRARAAGLSLDSVLADLHAPVPQHRYRVLAARALDLCNDVKSLGAALLSAMEKRDAESLAKLRSQHEVALHRRVREVRKAQIKDASEQIKVLGAQTKTVTERRKFYEGRKRINGKEKRHRIAMWVAMGLDIGGAVAKTIAAFPKLVGPRLQDIGDGAVYLAEALLPAAASVARTVGQQALTQAGYERRAEDWAHQGKQATGELRQIEAQVVAADIRIAIAEQELSNTESQIEDSQAAFEFMRSKYTNEQLYGWMAGEISQVYKQAYNLAYRMALSAQQAYRFELQREDSFLGVSYFDQLRSGLL